MAINIAVTKGKGENNASLLRKFTRRWRGTGLSRSLRKDRYFERNISEYVTKKSKLTSIEKGKHYGELAKLGKLPERTSHN